MKVLIIDNLGYNIQYKNELLLLPYRFGIMRSRLKKYEIESDYLDIGMKIQKEYQKIDLQTDSKENIKYIRKILNKSNLDSYPYLIISATPMQYVYSNISETIDILKEIRQIYAGKIIIGGGITVGEYLFGHEYINRETNNLILNYVDYIITNKDFNAVIRIIKKEFGNNIISKNLKFVPEIIEEDINSSLENEECNLDGININEYSYSLRNILKSLGHTIDHAMEDETKIAVLPFKFIKGCRFRCSFCAFSGKESHLDVDNVINKIERLKNRYGISNYLFLNNYINFDKEYLKNLCNKLIKKNLNILWSDSVRINKFDSDTFSLLRKAGCVRIATAPDTTNKKIINYVKKNIELEDINNTLKYSHDSGIWNNFAIIFCYPYETKEEIISDFNYVIKNIKKGLINQFMYNIYSLVPNSPMFKDPEKYGLEIRNRSELFLYESSGIGTIKFDEIKGLDFEEKIKRNNIVLQKIEEKIRNLVNNNKLFAVLKKQDSHLIFYLENRFNDKQKGIEFIKNVKKINNNTE